MSFKLETNTWILMADVETYMLTRMGAHKIWTEDLPLPDKEAALITAYNQLTGCNKWEFPADVSTNMKIAQCEMALFLLVHQEDIDARKGLQAQGVISAGIVQENYDKDMIGELPIPAIVKQLLNEYETISPVQAIDLERDDDKDVL